MATSVLPSPVFISAILPWCSTMPPMSCTSKWRWPSVRLAASRTVAKAGTSRSSRSAPSSSCLRNMVRAGAQLGVGQLRDLRLKRVDRGDLRADTLFTMPIVRRAEDLGGESSRSSDSMDGSSNPPAPPRRPGRRGPPRGRNWPLSSGGGPASSSESVPCGEAENRARARLLDPPSRVGEEIRSPPTLVNASARPAPHAAFWPREQSLSRRDTRDGLAVTHSAPPVTRAPCACVRLPKAT